MPRLNHRPLMCELSKIVYRLLKMGLIRRGRSTNDERRMKETVRHMRRYLNT